MLLDMAGPMGLLCILIAATGALHQRWSNRTTADALKGLLFGLIAVLEMQIPFEPFEGVIIDLRAVPVVLAGAFLGWRGLFICVACALTMRAMVGGVGMTSGLMTIILAAYAGALWQKLAQPPRKRSAGHLLMLGAMASLSFGGVVFLPSDVAVWFVTHAMLPLGVTYLAIIPLLAMMLQREVVQAAHARNYEHGASVCPETGLMRSQSFVRDMTMHMLSPGAEPVAGVLVLEPAVPTWAQMLWGKRLEDEMKRAFALSLPQTLALGGTLGVTQGGRLLAPVLAAEISTHSDVQHRVAQVFEQLELRLMTGSKIPVAAQMRFIPACTVNELQKVTQLADSAILTERRPQHTVTQADQTGSDQVDADALFERFDDMLLARSVPTIEAKP